MSNDKTDDNEFGGEERAQELLDQILSWISVSDEFELETVIEYIALVTGQDEEHVFEAMTAHLDQSQQLMLLAVDETDSNEKKKLESIAALIAIGEGLQDYNIGQLNDDEQRDESV